MRDLEGKRVHSSVSLNSCTPTCSVLCSNPHCAKTSPYFAQAKITRGTPAYATQSAGHSTVGARYSPGACLAAPMPFNLPLSQALRGCSPHLSVHGVQIKLRAASQKPSAEPGRTQRNQWCLSLVIQPCSYYLKTYFTQGIQMSTESSKEKCSSLPAELPR